MKKHWKISLKLRRLLCILLLAYEIAFIIGMLINRNKVFEIVDAVLMILSIVIAIYIVTKPGDSEYKMIWILFVLIFPVFGGVSYLLFSSQLGVKLFGKHISKIELKTKDQFLLHGSAIEEVKQDAPEIFPQVSYLQNCAAFPVYNDSETEFYSPGEKFFDAMLKELEKAEIYIFLEYFIIEEGKMWNLILEILKEKAASGVTVKVLYDDMGSFVLLPTDYPKILAKYGIECFRFNPFRPFLSTEQNNRDHRKICVIDGKVAFTGGINLADEYINEYEKHGHWKDAGVICRGKAAWSFTVMFLQMWEFASHKEVSFNDYLPDYTNSNNNESYGYVQPYADSPMDNEHVGKHVYLNVINNAKKYLYICTPYLIIDDNIVTALRLAAKNGVDVRIITPHKWDKWFVHMTTRSYYRELLCAGVKIYEYSNGFIHSKNTVSDDITAIVGTTNLDYRSLYLHFECGVLMHKTKAVGEVKEDFLSTLEVCQLITEKECKGNIITRTIQSILRIFAPLM